MNIKVALHGMDKRSEERFLTIFKMNFSGQCERTNIDDADTVILDMDDKNIAGEWSAFRIKYPDIPVIIMAKDHVELTGTIYLSKPAKLAELLTALKDSSKKEINSNLKTSNNTHKAAKALQSRDTKSNHNKLEKSDSFELFYNPEKFLQGKILRAISEGNKMQKSMFLRCWKDHWIVTFPGSDSLLQNVGDNKIKTLGLVPLGDEEEQFSYSEHQFADNEILLMADTPADKVKLVPIERFLWDLTVKTARGRVPEGTSLDELYVVQHWPNLPRLAHSQNAMRISAFWINQPQSINHIVEKLNIPQKDVLTYFSAARSIGILIPAKRKEDSLSIPEIMKSDKKKRSIFAALIGKVSRNVKRKQETDDIEDRQVDYV